MSAIPVDDSDCPLPMYQVVPLNGQSLTLSFPNHTIIFIPLTSKIRLQVTVRWNFEALGYIKNPSSPCCEPSTQTESREMS